MNNKNHDNYEYFRNYLNSANLIDGIVKGKDMPSAETQRGIRAGYSYLFHVMRPESDTTLFRIKA